MKNYLSMGFGVNSIADYLWLSDHGIEFEAVFCDTGCEWPETYSYIKHFMTAMKGANKPKITILSPTKSNALYDPAVRPYSDLYSFYWDKRSAPSRKYRDCTDKFKIRPKEKYFEKPCFNYISIDYGESHRARISSAKKIESRYNLIENEIDRDGCKDIIKHFGFPVPPKSACFVCFNMKVAEWRTLRTEHPNLWCMALALENRQNNRRINEGLKPIGLSGGRKRITSVINENQLPVFEQDEYPSCHCGL